MSTYRPTWVEIDLGAIRHNVNVLSELVAPAAVMAIEKGLAVQDVPYGELRGRLEKDGQVLDYRAAK